MRALSFLAPKGLRQKRIGQEQFAKPGKLTAISCFLLGSDARRMAVSGWVWSRESHSERHSC